MFLQKCISKKILKCRFSLFKQYMMLKMLFKKSLINEFFHIIDLLKMSVMICN